jgi:DNA ligase-1
MDVCKLLIFLLFVSITLAGTPARAADFQTPPDLPLAGIYQKGIDVRRFWVSEKLDGVRAYWDGHHLRSRQGNIYPAPDWYKARFPPIPLDGELWIGRGQFESLVGIVRKQVPDDAEWRRVRYMVFDLPEPDTPFTFRLKRLQRLLQRLNLSHLRPVPQYHLPDHNSLMRKLRQVVAAGGEGLMLHRADSLYQGGRSSDLLKVKSHLDAEAQVVGHIPGKGKYQGMLGALLVERPDGIRFRIGTGFSDRERRQPPAIGKQITYKYFGLTAKGIPRFASFLRVRDG